MKIKSINVVNGNTVINYINKNDEECAYWFNGTTDVASATNSFIAMMNAGLL